MFLCGLFDLVPAATGIQHLLVPLGMFELDVLQQTALRAVAAAALLGLAVVPLLDLVCSPPEALFALRGLLAHLVLKLLLSSLLRGHSVTS